MMCLPLRIQLTDTRDQLIDMLDQLTDIQDMLRPNKVKGGLAIHEGVRQLCLSKLCLLPTHMRTFQIGMKSLMLIAAMHALLNRRGGSRTLRISTDVGSKSRQPPNGMNSGH